MALMFAIGEKSLRGGVDNYSLLPETCVWRELFNPDWRVDDMLSGMCMDISPADIARRSLSSAVEVWWHLQKSTASMNELQCMLDLIQNARLQKCIFYRLYQQVVYTYLRLKVEGRDDVKERAARDRGEDIPTRTAVEDFGSKLSHLVFPGEKCHLMSHMAEDKLDWGLCGQATDTESLERSHIPFAKKLYERCSKQWGMFLVEMVKDTSKKINADCYLRRLTTSGHLSRTADDRCARIGRVSFSKGCHVLDLMIAQHLGQTVLMLLNKKGEPQAGRCPYLHKQVTINTLGRVLVATAATTSDTEGSSESILRSVVGLGNATTRGMYRLHAAGMMKWECGECGQRVLRSCQSYVRNKKTQLSARKVSSTHSFISYNGGVIGMIVAILPVSKVSGQGIFCACFLVVATMREINRPSACLPYPTLSFSVTDSACELEVISEAQLDKPVFAVPTDPSMWNGEREYELSANCAYYVVAPTRVHGVRDDYDTYYARINKSSLRVFMEEVEHEETNLELEADMQVFISSCRSRPTAL